MIENPHAKSFQEVLDAFSVSDDGLSAEESAKRLEEYGPNALVESGGTSALQIFFEQWKNVLIIILCIAVGISALLGHVVEASVIGSIVFLSVLIGFMQEYKAEKVMEALRNMAAPLATAIRDGEEIEVKASELVPGDIIVLTAGDIVPADGRIIECANIQTDEASLTGESLPAEKSIEAIAEDAATGDKENIVFSGTHVTYGRGKAVVVATGMETEFGKIANMLQSVKTELTPLQKNLDKVGHLFAKIALVIVAVIGVLGFIRGQSLIEMLLFGIALAVAVVPEALPAVVTISLAISVQRMVKKHALVRKQPVVETLGSTTVICTDKTGTLTKDEMTVQQVYCAHNLWSVTGIGYKPEGGFELDEKEADPSASLLELLKGGTLCADAVLHQNDEGVYEIHGDPTEGGIIVAAQKAGIHKADIDSAYPRIDEIPFTSETKKMLTQHKESDDSTMIYCKGAPEVVLSCCDRIWLDEEEGELTDAVRKQVLEAAEGMAKNALRVIAIARKGNASLEDSESGMKFLGLIGMIDPPRPEAKTAIEKCKTAGIKVKMITGDHPVTAKAIADNLGILENDKVLIGSEIEALDDEALSTELNTVSVFARVSPTHKLRIVSLLQQQGHIVAMTGDGVNDAPALKKADIGVAMGITGTDVTKEASDMILTDDNFASIVSAVEEGRGVFGNIKKYLIYLLSANLGEVALMTGATMFGLPMPLTAAQILYVNLVTDGFPALALAVDPHPSDLMTRTPRNPQKGMFTKGMIILLIARGCSLACVCLGIFAWILHTTGSLTQATTLCFITIILIEFLLAYSLRSERKSILHNTFKNKWLNLSVILQLPIFLGILYIPFFHKPFHIVAPALSDWFIVLPAALISVPILEFAKYIVRKNGYEL